MCGRGVCVVGACVAGGMHGRGHAWQGGMHGRGACVAGGMHGRGCACHTPRQILWQQHTVYERAVRILLECILLPENFTNMEKIEPKAPAPPPLSQHK